MRMVVAVGVGHNHKPSSYTSTAHRDQGTSTTMIPRRLKVCVKMTVLIIVITLIFIVIAALSKRNNVFNFINVEKTPEYTSREMGIGGMFFDKLTHSMVFEKNSGEAAYFIMALKSKHFLNSGKLKTYSDCIKHSKSGSISSSELVLCLVFDNVNAAVYKKKVDNINCHIVEWVLRNEDLVNPKIVLDQCVDMKENWYGGGAISEHRWPLNRVNVPMQPYITRKFNRSMSNGKVHFESFLEPYFVSASGVALVFDSFLPLFVSINDNNDKKLCFNSAFEKPYQFTKSAQTLLKFTVCKDTFAKDVHKHLLKGGVLNRPLFTPSVDIFQKPVWSTRGIDLENINENILLAYIKNLKNSRLNHSQLFIDGNYSRSPGSVYFNNKRFPHAAQLAMELDSHLPHEKLKLATEVFPLLPELVSSQNFSYYPNSRDSDSKDKSEGVLLDISNKKAVDWYTSQLDFIISQVKVKGFRFSGGHAFSVLDRIGHTIAHHEPKELLHPDEITHKFGNIAGKFQGNSYLASGYRNQRLGLIADAGPFLASWSHLKGLKSVVPTVITYGIMGYPFISAGPIGGISFQLNSSSGHFALSERNLYLRWIQLATFLPIMDFSVGPWQYDTEVVTIAKNLTNYRQNEIWPKHLLPAIKEASDTGIPVIRPLWWVAPSDITAQFIDCEFMVGDNLLVAPVLQQGDMMRQIYLPLGTMWRDVLRNGILYEGGQWLRDYPVEEFEIAHFVRVAASPNSESSTKSQQSVI